MGYAKWILISIFILAASQVFAETKMAPQKVSQNYNTKNYSGYNYTSGSSYSGSGGNTHRMAISGALGFYSFGAAAYIGQVNGRDRVDSPAASGLFGIGGDFDYFLNNDLSVGGLFRYYSTTDSFAGTDITNGLWTLGGTVKVHIVDVAKWNFYATTGLGVLQPSYKTSPGNDDSIPMGFGFYLGMGLLYKINETMAFGVENMRMIAVGEKIQGWPLNDFMFKGRFFIGE